VCLGASLERANRWAVDPNRAEIARREIAGCLRRDSNIVLEEHSGLTARRVSSLEEQSFTLADSMRPKFVDIDDAWVSNRDDARGTYRSIERKLVNGAAPAQIVQGRVDVRPRMSAHR